MTAFRPSFSNNWIDRIIAPSSILATITGLTAKARKTGERDFPLDDLVEAMGDDPNLVMQMIDDCDEKLEHLYGVPLFAFAKRPSHFRYAQKLPKTLTLSSKFLQVCDGRVLSLVPFSGAFHETSTSMREIVEAAEAEASVNYIVQLPSRRSSSARFAGHIEAFASGLNSATYDMGIDVYAPVNDADGNLPHFGGGSVMLAAGLLPAGRKIILCRRPDFTVSKLGFDVWNGNGEPRAGWEPDYRSARAFVVANTPGVKIWLCDDLDRLASKDLFSNSFKYRDIL